MKTMVIFSLLIFAPLLAHGEENAGDHNITEFVYEGKSSLIAYPEQDLSKVTHFTAREIVGDEEEMKTLKKMTNIKRIYYGCDDPKPLPAEVLDFFATRTKLVELNLEIDIRKSQDLSFLDKLRTVKLLSIRRSLWSLQFPYVYDMVFYEYIRKLRLENLVVDGPLADGVVEKIESDLGLEQIENYRFSK